MSENYAQLHELDLPHRRQLVIRTYAFLEDAHMFATETAQAQMTAVECKVFAQLRKDALELERLERFHGGLDSSVNHPPYESKVDCEFCLSQVKLLDAFDWAIIPAANALTERLRQNPISASFFQLR